LVRPAGHLGSTGINTPLDPFSSWASPLRTVFEKGSPRTLDRPTLPEARFIRTAVYSMALYAMPLHVARTVRHACKLLPPWSIKGGAVPQPQGDDGQRTCTLSAFTTILALASISTSGTWRTSLLSRLACSPLCKHHGAP
jgi:hypothetical protein